MSAKRPPDIGLGVLTQWCPPSLVDEVIEKYDARERRVRLLPARSMVYCELARCLFPGQGYEQVFEHLLPYGEAEWHAAGEPHVPHKSSLCRARAKVGAATLEAIFHQVAGPLAEPESCPAAFWRGLRIEAFDGTVLDVADTAENAEEFTRPAGSCGPGGYPQARVVALVECGTHAILDAVIGGRQEGETTLAMGLAASAGPDALVLADRGMLGVALWNAFRAAGAQLLGRLKNTTATRPYAVLADGSWLAKVRIDKHTAAALRRAGHAVPSAVTIRVIEYTLPESDEVYRLGTSLLDPITAPAVELATLYHERWESEGIYSEVKTAQRGSRGVLRSSTSDGVRQEIWAHLTVHHLTRRLIHHAATNTGQQIDPRRISFRRAQHLIRRDIATNNHSPHRATKHIAAKLTRKPAADRRPRTYPRAVKRRATPFPTKTPIMRPTRRDPNFAPTIRHLPP